MILLETSTFGQQSISSTGLHLRLENISLNQPARGMSQDKRHIRQSDTREDQSIRKTQRMQLKLHIQVDAQLHIPPVRGKQRGFLGGDRHALPSVCLTCGEQSRERLQSPALELHGWGLCCHWCINQSGVFAVGVPLLRRDLSLEAARAPLLFNAASR